jgi:hypothetical protein
MHVQRLYDECYGNCWAIIDDHRIIRAKGFQSEEEALSFIPFVEADVEFEDDA